MAYKQDDAIMEVVSEEPPDTRPALMAAAMEEVQAEHPHIRMTSANTMTATTNNLTLQAIMPDMQNTNEVHKMTMPEAAFLAEAHGWETQSVAKSRSTGNKSTDKQIKEEAQSEPTIISPKEW